MECGNIAVGIWISLCSSREVNTYTPSLLVPLERVYTNYVIPLEDHPLQDQLPVFL